jgi:hypothetical protein
MHPGRGRPSGRPAAALGARASRPQSRRFSRLTPFRHQARRGLLRFRRGGRGHASNPKPTPKPNPNPNPNRDPNPNPNHLQDEEDFYDDVDEMGYDDFDEDGEDWGDDDDMLYSSS